MLACVRDETNYNYYSSSPLRLYAYRHYASTLPAQANASRGLRGLLVGRSALPRRGLAAPVPPPAEYPFTGFKKKR